MSFFPVDYSYIFAQFFKGYAPVIVTEFKKCHFVFAVRTFQRIVAEGKRMADQTPDEIHSRDGYFKIEGQGS